MGLCIFVHFDNLKVTDTKSAHYVIGPEHESSYSRNRFTYHFCLIYINDIVRISNILQIILFADDTLELQKLSTKKLSLNIRRKILL